MALGLAVLDDYGISWDESIQRRHGRVSIDYAADKLGIDGYEKLEPEWDLEDYQWSNYGMIYQITANLLEQKLGYEDDPYHYYKLRHCLAFGLFWLACLYFYRTLRLRFPDKAWYPLIGTLALVLSPRIFANGFYNPKDHILLVFYVISTFTMLRFLKERSWRNLIFHAFATGLALNTRLPALIVPLTTCLILGWEMLRDRSEIRANLKWIAVYLPLSVAFMVPFFPYLWEDTFSRLIGAFSEMSAFDWDSTVWLFGNRISALDVPWYYIPAWIIITTPIIFLLFIFSGVFATGKHMLSSLRDFRWWSSKEELLDFSQLGLAVGPILVVILLGSTLYNGWRHLHFVFPSFVFLLMVGYDYGQRNWARPQVQSWILGAGLVLTAVQMARYHPHQYVYFNAAIQGEPLNVRFDMDYWGVGFRDAFLQLADQIPEGETRAIKCEVWPCKDNYKSLPPEAKAKLTIATAWHKADYLATNFIWPNTRYDVRDRKEHFAFPVVEVRPAGDLIVGIYDLRAAKAASAPAPKGTE
ncbi:ArnT family glycosyltransferase [Neolewinella agarilytica]|uniref:ArnT family glycosyltransferase n=1 Tax=Neolewinella agarilytica TaxID=478744 RepID=UPI0023534DDD|nr:glycosyltransferase family 39 protein [Neolewinella agarilytica]